MKKYLVLVILILILINSLYSEEHLFFNKMPSGIIKVDNLRVRSQPNLNGQILSKLNTNEVVGVVEKSKNTQQISNFDEHWYLISNNNITGWVYGGFLDLSNNTYEIPIGYYDDNEADYIQLPQNNIYEDNQLNLWKLSRRNMIPSRFGSSRFDQLILQINDDFFKFYNKHNIELDKDYSINHVEVLKPDIGIYSLVIEMFITSVGERGNFQIKDIDLILLNSSQFSIEFIENTGLSHSMDEPPMYNFEFDTNYESINIIGVPIRNYDSSGYYNLQINRIIEIKNSMLIWNEIYNTSAEELRNIPRLYKEKNTNSEVLDLQTIYFRHAEIISVEKVNNVNWYFLYLWGNENYSGWVPENELQIINNN